VRIQIEFLDYEYPLTALLIVHFNFFEFLDYGYSLTARTRKRGDFLFSVEVERYRVVPRSNRKGEELSETRWVGIEGSAGKKKKRKREKKERDKGE
jgi:hypothetical protein